MALRGTLQHRKTRRLARILGIAPCFALGILEAMWAVNREQTPTGAIGRLSNEDLADALGYTECENKLVQALLDAGWLDEHPLHRLIVHDWHDHSDNTLDAKLYRHGEKYACGRIPRGTKVGKDEKAELYERFYKQPAESLFAAAPPHVAPILEATATPETPPRVLQFPSAPHGAAKRLPVPEPVPVPVPEPVSPPSPARSGEMDRMTRKELQREVVRRAQTDEGQHIDRASRHVVQACKVTGPPAATLQAKVWMAIDAECRARGQPPATEAMVLAELMVMHWRLHCENRHLLKCSFGLPRFISEGHWLGDGTWSWDHQAIQRQRDAAVGAYR